MFYNSRTQIKRLLRFLGFKELLLRYKIFRLNNIRSKELVDAKIQILNSGRLNESENLILKDVSLKVHLEDTMYVKGRAEHYLSVGLSAIKCIQLALSKSGKDSQDVKYILDFPSGYGRVLRFIKAKFPESMIYAAEIEKNALLFCKKEFSVKSILSSPGLNDISIPHLFDLIWCGSLITHFNEDQIIQLLLFFQKMLNKNGILVFTSHGQKPYNGLKSKRLNYGLSESSIQLVVNEFEKTGFGYSNYDGSLKYGISICSFEKMESLILDFPDLELIHFEESFWDDHQDLYCVRKK